MSELTGKLAICLSERDLDHHDYNDRFDMRIWAGPFFADYISYKDYQFLGHSVGGKLCIILDGPKEGCVQCIFFEMYNSHKIVVGWIKQCAVKILEE